MKGCNEDSGPTAPTPTVVPAYPPTSFEIRRSYYPYRPMLYAGALTFAGTYIATAAATYEFNLYDGKGDRSLYVPVVGPWVHLATSAENPRDAALIAASGVLQSVGVGAVLLSLVIPESVHVATIKIAGAVRLVAPIVTGSRGAWPIGVGVQGAF